MVPGGYWLFLVVLVGSLWLLVVPHVFFCVSWAFFVVLGDS